MSYLNLGTKLWHVEDERFSASYGSTTLCGKYSVTAKQSNADPGEDLLCAMCWRNRNARIAKHPAIRESEALPKAAELTGSDPDFTGSLSTDEYIRSIRRG